MKKSILLPIMLCYSCISTGLTDALELDLDTIEEQILSQLNEKENELTENITEEIARIKEEELKVKFTKILSEIITNRNEYVLTENYEGLENLYNLDVKVSRYAFEREVIKAKYLKTWAQKQGVTFTDIVSNLKLRKVRDRLDSLYGMTCNICTTYTYFYNDEPEKLNIFSLGTSHYIHLKEEEDQYKIVKEWYTDPFSDSLEMELAEPDEHTQFLMAQELPDFIPNETLQKAIEYAQTYCGIGADENMFKYNKQYMDCNSLGGDCANFASQIMYESGAFKKNEKWNYTDEGTKTWVNAQELSLYLINSGRGNRIAQGSYETIYKAAFKLRPGDIVAYEKNDRITHVSTVTSLDSKGYPLVTCHNTDRLAVPYDLGWSNSNIIFHLIDVHY
ncbi:amidase domain-containing protein [Candidatus Epulonipiscium viviparus]|uniref:amidase domain-containing protein n=1 Tax=Candidatus Epulonipiscium viviparus TaxID=420336 RepID=UPI00016C0026|nr:amidase domain-containing protein [Candidatus Epulopiscium viviparus]